MGVICAIALVTSPAAAGAEIRTISLSDGTLEIKGGAGADEIEVSAGRRRVEIGDSDGVPSPGPACDGTYTESSDSVACPRSAVDEVIVDLDDGDNAFDGDGDVRFEVEGGKDADLIDGGDARDLLEGKLGDDELDGSDGGDQLLGGLGDDLLTGKAGRDLLDGGPGRDKGDGGSGKDRCSGIERAAKGACS